MKKGIMGVVFGLTIMFVSCRESPSGDSITKHGYIIFDDPNYWHFVPVETIDTTNCFKNIESSKFDKGFQFDPSSLNNLSYIQRTLDTLVSAKTQMAIKITPVEVKFTFNPKYLDLYQSESSDPNWNFRYSDSVKGQSIAFIYNIFPVKIQAVKPLFCLDKKISDIEQCNCEHKKDGANDYVFKACKYLLKQDPYSLVACQYGIRSIETDTLNQKTVTRVELTCCGLGDVAFFDSETKDIITISYGAK